METRNKQNDQSAYNSVISEMLKDSGIKTKIIKQYLPVINKTGQSVPADPRLLRAL